MLAVESAGLSQTIILTLSNIGFALSVNRSQSHLDSVIMPDLHSLPAGSRPDKAIRNNGPDNLALERFKLRELAEGWPMYRYVSLVDAKWP